MLNRHAVLRQSAKTAKNSKAKTTSLRKLLIKSLDRVLLTEAQSSGVAVVVKGM